MSKLTAANARADEALVTLGLARDATADARCALEHAEGREMRAEHAAIEATRAVIALERPCGVQNAQGEHCALEPGHDGLHDADGACW